MTRYISLKDTNKLIRAALKESFPGAKFSVVGDSYAGGASTRVSWTDGPAKHDVEAVVDKFAGASFDGMIDLKSYHTSELKGEQVHFGADYVFADREVSPEEIARLRPEVEAELARQGEVSEFRYYEGVCIEGIDRVLFGGLDSIIRTVSEYRARKVSQ